MGSEEPTIIWPVIADSSINPGCLVPGSLIGFSSQYFYMCTITNYGHFLPVNGVPFKYNNVTLKPIPYNDDTATAYLNIHDIAHRLQCVEENYKVDIGSQVEEVLPSAFFLHTCERKSWIIKRQSYLDLLNRTTDINNSPKTVKIGEFQVKLTCNDILSAIPLSDSDDFEFINDLNNSKYQPQEVQVQPYDTLLMDITIDAIEITKEEVEINAVQQEFSEDDDCEQMELKLADRELKHFQNINEDEELLTDLNEEDEELLTDLNEEDEELLTDLNELDLQTIDYERYTLINK